MARPLVIAGSLALTCALAGASAYMLLAKPSVKGNVVNMAETPRHPVTQEMVKGALAEKGKKAPEFELTSSEGVRVSSRALLEKGPLVVVMTKDGCPCSIESQPFFNVLAKNYKGKAEFVGVLDASIPIAQLYARAHSVPYPILCEPKGDVFKAFGAKQSVYVFLIGTDGLVEKVWPGYSKEMLAEMNEELSRLTSVEAKLLNTEDAPKEMTSGCYFFKDDPTVTLGK